MILKHQFGEEEKAEKKKSDKVILKNHFLDHALTCSIKTQLEVKKKKSYELFLGCSKFSLNNNNNEKQDLLDGCFLNSVANQILITE